MFKHFSFVRLLYCLLLSTLLIGTNVGAQETCTAPTADTLSALVEACSTSAVDTACKADGTTSPLDQLVSDGQPHLIRLRGAGGDLTVILVGSEVSAYEQGEVAGVGQIEIGNAAGYNVNLRSGPGSNFDVVAIFRFDERLMTDGQSADGAWLRVALDDGTVAWVNKSLVSNDPTLATLPIVDQGSSAALGHVLTVARADSACADSQTGAFISGQGDATQRLTVNDVPLAITDGTVFMSVDERDVTFYALAGGSTVGSGDQQQTLDSGDVIAWSDAPGVPDPLTPFPALDLISALALEPDVCLISVADAPVDAFAEPDADSAVVATLSPGVSYVVHAQSSMDTITWLHLSDGYGSGWVGAENVNTIGACAALPDATAAPVSVPVIGAGLSPEQIIYNYLAARVVADAAQMQSLSCASWDQQALLQSQSFRAMRAELLNVACYTVSQSGGSATVRCDGVIQTEYNGELRQWELGSYAMTQENGAWRVCGEAG